MISELTKKIKEETKKGQELFCQVFKNELQTLRDFVILEKEEGDDISDYFTQCSNSYDMGIFNFDNDINIKVSFFIFITDEANDNPDGLDATEYTRDNLKTEDLRIQVEVNDIKHCATFGNIKDAIDFYNKHKNL